MMRRDPRDPLQDPLAAGVTPVVNASVLRERLELNERMFHAAIEQLRALIEMLPGGELSHEDGGAASTPNEGGSDDHAD